MTAVRGLLSLFLAGSLAGWLISCMADADPIEQPPPTTLPDGPLTACTIAQRILVPRCAGCHKAGAQGPDLSTLEAVKAQIGVTITAGNKDGSLLYRKIAGTQSPTEGARMPVGVPLAVELITATGRPVDRRRREDRLHARRPAARADALPSPKLGAARATRLRARARRVAGW
jgi:hypothetical protein